MIGKGLGPYQVLSKLGEGGMGEVYRAHDPRMGRDVAIKIVADRFSDRLSREVHAVAALNHPSICTIHDVGPDYIVMELIEGPTLAEKIGSGLRAEALAKAGAGIPLSEILPIARQIAEALEAAHAKGIVHRDLKPANVMLKDGVTVKVLDFGLAKAGGASQAGEAGGDLANSPTMLSPGATQAGVILGTAAYMAPEQARGKPIDKRADIWAFGCVLYEMLTGRRPFGGDEVSDTLAFIITKDPDWAALPADTPAAIRRLLRRCLQKNPHDRLHDIADARIELTDVLASPDLETRTPATPALPMWRRAMPWTVAALAVISAGVVIATRQRPWQAPAAHVEHFTIPLPNGTVPTEGGIAVSADGAQIAFAGGPARQIFVRAIDQIAPKAIAGTEGATFLAFSPDGRWISYVDGDSPKQVLRKVPVAGGASQDLAQADSRDAPPGQSWVTDDTILFAHSGGLLRIPADGGSPQVLEKLDRASTFKLYFDAHLLPGGRELLALTKGGTVAVDVQTLATRTVVGRVEGLEGWPRFAATSAASTLGHLVSYDRAASSLVAIPFDAGTLQVRGPATRVLQGVQAVVGPYGWFGFSDSGTLAYVEGAADVRESMMVWVDRTGAEQKPVGPARRYTGLRLSPDSARLAAEIDEGSSLRQERDVWVYDLARGTLTRVTFDKGSEGLAWTPDSKQVAHLRRVRRDEGFDLELRSAPVDGTQSTTLMTLRDDQYFVPTSISPDRRALIGSAARSGGTNPVPVIMVARLNDAAAGAAPATPLIDSPFGQQEAQFSPDGRFVAYQSAESGRDEIHVVSYPKLDAKWQVSVDGGTVPRWSANGRELFYRNGDKMIAVDVMTTPTFSPGAPRVLFEGRYRPFVYDVSPDGRRFLMLKAVSGQERPTELHVIVNWYEELRRKAPLPK